MHGLETTLGVTLDMMITHGKAVMRGSRHALVAVDMPFGSYEESPAIAFRNAVRVIQETGATAVKMEGGTRMAETIRYLTERGIPVMGHIGLTPQSFNVMGGFKTTGRTEAEWPAAAGRRQGGGRGGRLCRGAGRHGRAFGRPCHRRNRHPHHRHRRQQRLRRQILVMEDMLGLNPNPPKFVREYASLGPAIEAAVEAYATDVRERRFPGVENVYPMKRVK